MSEHRTPRLLGLGAVTLAVVVSACVDAPSAPADDVGSGALFFAPQITLVGPAGPATSLAQTDALDEAFDRVDRFRMVVRRASDNRIVVDTVISVTPGLDEYNLAVQLLGAGFDWIIPSNNRVFWPTADAYTETAVSAATSGSLTTVMPRAVAAG